MDSTDLHDLAFGLNFAARAGFDEAQPQFREPYYYGLMAPCQAMLAASESLRVAATAARNQEQQGPAPPVSTLPWNIQGSYSNWTPLDPVLPAMRVWNPVEPSSDAPYEPFVPTRPDFWKAAQMYVSDFDYWATKPRKGQTPWWLGGVWQEWNPGMEFNPITHTWENNPRIRYNWRTGELEAVGGDRFDWSTWLAENGGTTLRVITDPVRSRFRSFIPGNQQVDLSTSTIMDMVAIQLERNATIGAYLNNIISEAHSAGRSLEIVTWKDFFKFQTVDLYWVIPDRAWPGQTNWAGVFKGNWPSVPNKCIGVDIGFLSADYLESDQEDLEDAAETALHEFVHLFTAFVLGKPWSAQWKGAGNEGAPHDEGGKVEKMIDWRLNSQ